MALANTVDGITSLPPRL